LEWGVRLLVPGWCGVTQSTAAPPEAHQHTPICSKLRSYTRHAPAAGEPGVCVPVAVLSSARPEELVDLVDCAWLEPSHGSRGARSFPPHRSVVLRGRDTRKYTSIHWCYLHDGSPSNYVALALPQLDNCAPSWPATRASRSPSPSFPRSLQDVYDA
jgi:hypothetical protein